jgi:hypothetical protein
MCPRPRRSQPLNLSPNLLFNNTDFGVDRIRVGALVAKNPSTSRGPIPRGLKLSEPIGPVRILLRAGDGPFEIGRIDAQACAEFIAIPTKITHTLQLFQAPVSGSVLVVVACSYSGVQVMDACRGIRPRCG